MYLRGTPCWLPSKERSFSRAAGSSCAASSFEKGCQSRPMRKRPLIRNAFTETASQGAPLLKNLLGSADFREGGSEVLADVLRNLPRNSADRHQVLRIRVREVLRCLEARVHQGLRPCLPDSLDCQELARDVRLLRPRGLQLEDVPLDFLIPGAQLQGLRVRAQCVVVPAHLHEHVALRGPGRLVARVELRQTVEHVEGAVRFALFEE